MTSPSLPWQLWTLCGLLSLGAPGCMASGQLGGSPRSDDDDAIANDDDSTESGDDDDSTEPGDDDDSTSPFDSGIDDLLASTFRIDIARIDVGLDYTPGDETFLGEATVRFTMRPDQTVPLIHFTPIADVGLDSIATISLDGEALDPQDQDDVRRRLLTGSSQWVLELQRTVDPTAEHTLEMTWESQAWWEDVAPGWLFTDVSDIAGEGNEILFPTINSPDELSRHVIELRVHSGTPYRVLGSGLVTEQGAQGGPEPVQVFQLDTERQVSSITVLLIAAPRDEVLYEERTVAGVPVRIAAITEPEEVEQAFDDAEAVLNLLQDDFGPLPMERGLSVLLTTDYGGGMEYFGGTISDGWALQHELVHMYFGTSTVARTWRDSWWDEAINVWYLWPGSYDSLWPGYGSDIVSGQTAVQPAFDTRAYDEGAAIFDLVADRVGGRQALIEALAAIRDEHTFAPFTTGDLIVYLEETTGVDLSEEFARWVYGQ